MQTRAVILRRDQSGLSQTYELKETFECPPVDEKSVVVRIKACGLSLPNSKILEEFKINHQIEQPVGTEIAGVVTSVGSAVTLVSTGDEVAGLVPLGSASAGCANFCVISEYDIVKKPEKVEHVDAAGCIGDAVRAYTALHYQARVCGGETVLICNGASSSGNIAIQLAQAWGAKVLTTACTEEEIIFLESMQPRLGTVIDLKNTKKSLVDICMEETAGLGVDCVVDNGVVQYSEEFCEAIEDSRVHRTVVQTSKHELISCLAVGGRWVTSQQDLQLDPPDSRLLYLKACSVSFLFAHSWALSRGQQGRYLHILTDIMDKLANSLIRPVIHHTVSLEDTCDALKQLSSHNVGKIVVKM